MDLVLRGTISANCNTEKKMWTASLLKFLKETALTEGTALALSLPPNTGAQSWSQLPQSPVQPRPTFLAIRDTAKCQHRKRDGNMEVGIEGEGGRSWYLDDPKLTRNHALNLSKQAGSFWEKWVKEWSREWQPRQAWEHCILCLKREWGGRTGCRRQKASSKLDLARVSTTPDEALVSHALLHHRKLHAAEWFCSGNLMKKLQVTVWRNPSK